MNERAMIKIILLLELFAILVPISHSESNIPSETTVKLSSSEENHLARLSSDDKTFFERLLKAHAGLKIQHSSLSTAHASLATEHSSLATNFHNFQCLMPNVDMKCAMSRMKIGLADFFDMHVKRMRLTKPYVSTGMDTHTGDIVAKNDKCPEKVRSMDWKKSSSDCSSADQWYRYITERESSDIPFSIKTIQNNLINALESYYNKLDKNIKDKRGYTDLSTFKRRFASVITRCHRIACHFHRAIEKAMALLIHSKNEQGNTHSLSSALLDVVPAWYFDSEHIEFLNIIQELLKDPDRYYAVMTITNSENQQVVIPGLPNCFKETVTPDFYPKIYSIMP